MLKSSMRVLENAEIEDIPRVTFTLLPCITVSLLASDNFTRQYPHQETNVTAAMDGEGIEGPASFEPSAERG